MATFLNRFAVDGRFGKGGGMLGKARAAGYSSKQIARAISRGGHGLTIGQALRPGSALHTQMATSNQGRPGNWIFDYMGPSGAVGIGGLNRALGAGRTVEELISAGALTSGGTQNYGVAGFGQKASDYLSQQQQEEEEEVDEDAMWAERIANIPTATELMEAMPEPKIRAGQDYATTGRSAQGMRIKRGTKFAEGGKRGTKGYFGRGAKFTGNSAPAMNIKGGGGGSASQASNTLNTV